MWIKGLKTRYSAILEILRLFVGRGCGPTVHLCHLVSSSQFSGLPTISLVGLFETLTPPASVTLHPSLHGRGSGAISEMAAIAAIAAAKQPRTILEFGTCHGFSSWHMRANAPNAKIFTVDLPQDSGIAGSWDDNLQTNMGRPFLPRDSNTRLIETDSRSWSPDLPARVDLCFIDAGHSYENVRNDTEKSFQVMNTDGIILWHDSTQTWDGYGVNRYLRDLRQNGRDVRLLKLGPFDYCALALLLC